jgi:hypothetical protein
MILLTTVVIILLIIIGLFLIFGVDFHRFILAILEPFDKRAARQRKINYLTFKKEGFLSKQLSQIEDMMVTTGQKGKLSSFKVSCFLSSLAGFLLGLILNNLPLAFVLAFGFALLPFIFITKQMNAFNKTLLVNLQSGLALITSKYQHSVDFITAIQSVKDRLQEPVRRVFNEFLVDMNFIDQANTEAAINKMKQKINHPLWIVWCNIAERSLNDNIYRLSLQDVVNDLNEMVVTQNQMDTGTNVVIANYVRFVIIIAAGCIMFAVFYRPWYLAMTDTDIGRFAIAILVLLIILVGIYMAKISRPMRSQFQYEEDDE